MKRLPNLLTLANAASGVAALYFIASLNGTGVAIALIASAVFDGLDGWAARKFGSDSELGKQLDSLADAISFGATAGLLWNNILAHLLIPQPFAIIGGALVSAASVYRLAKFNLDPTQSLDFKGMPTPSNALFALGIWAWLQRSDFGLDFVYAEQSVQLTAQVIAFALLAISIYWQNAPLRVISLKEDPTDLRRKWLQRIAALLFLAMLPFLKVLSISIVVLLLPVLGLFHKPN